MARKPSDERTYVLEPILKKLEHTQQGSFFTIEDIPSQIDKIRSWLYQYFDTNGLTKYYKLTREAPDILQLNVRRRNLPILKDAPIKTLEASRQTLESILDLPEPEALLEIRKAVDANRLTDSEAISVMEEYTRVMST